MPSSNDQPGFDHSLWLPAVVGAIGVVLSLFIWSRLHGVRADAVIDDRLLRPANAIAAEFADLNRQRLSVMRLLLATAHDGVPAELPNILEPLGCDTLALVDRSTGERLTLSSQSDSTLEGLPAAPDESAGRWSRLRHTEDPEVLLFELGAQLESGYAICLSGIAADFDRITRKVADDISVVISNEDRVIYQRILADRVPIEWHFSTSIPVPGEAWQLEVYFSEQQFSLSRRRIFEIALALFLGMTLLLTAATRFAQSLVQRDRVLVETNYELHNAARQREQALRDLAQIRQHFYQLVDHIDGAFWIVSADGRDIHFMSEGHERIWGQSLDELERAPERLLNAVVPEDREKMTGAAATLGDGRPRFKRPYRPEEADGYDIEYRVRSADGRVRWVRERGYPVRDENGVATRIVGITEDITNRKRIERALARSEARFRRLYESNLIGIVFGDRHGNIFDANDAFLGLAGLGRDDLPFQWEIVSTPATFKKDIEAFVELEDGGVARPWTTALRRHGDSDISVLAGAALLEESRNQIIAFVIDLTQLKQAEARLLKITEDLQRSNASLEEFAHVASHDLKEPLRGIHNYASFLADDYAGKLDENGLYMLETMKMLTRRMEGLLEGLRDYSRLGKSEFDVEPADLNAVVEEVLDLLHVDIREKQIDIRIPRPLPTVRCDAARLRELFSNLVTNASKYNDKDDKWIEIGYRDSDPPEFYVSDNGIGIDQRHHDKIFNIFKRLHGRDEFGGGAGAGLTIARRTVEMHGGRLWVESEPGLGTTFRFTLERGPDKGDE